MHIGRLNDSDVNAIDRAYLGTLVTYNAVLYLIVQLVTPNIRYWELLKGILNSEDAIWLLKVCGILNSDGAALLASLHQVFPGTSQPLDTCTNATLERVKPLRQAGDAFL